VSSSSSSSSSCRGKSAASLKRLASLEGVSYVSPQPPEDAVFRSWEYGADNKPKAVAAFESMSLFSSSSLDKSIPIAQQAEQKKRKTQRCDEVYDEKVQ
jgi:hypothetical protein